MYFIGYKGTIYEMPCGSLCGGEGVTPVTEEPAPTPTTKPVNSGDPAPTTLSPVVTAGNPDPTPVETPAPVTPEPVTAEPVTAEPVAPVRRYKCWHRRGRSLAAICFIANRTAVNLPDTISRVPTS